jgi:hypothetical protein
MNSVATYTDSRNKGIQDEVYNNKLVTNYHGYNALKLKGHIGFITSNSLLITPSAKRYWMLTPLFSIPCQLLPLSGVDMQ